MLGAYKAQKMTDLNENVDARSMVPRVLKTNIGDIFTTNTINAAALNIGDLLKPGADGYLAPYDKGCSSEHDGMEHCTWQVVKIYTMPDGQRGAKIMRIA